MTNMVDAVGAAHYGYEVAGQLLSEDGPWSDDILTMRATSLLCQWFITAFITLLPSVTSGQQSIGIPNQDLLGSSLISTNLPVLINYIDSTKISIFPKEVRVVLTEDGFIDEIQAFYSEKIRIAQIAEAVNMHYKNEEMTELRSNGFRLWKVLSKQFVIQLSNRDEGKLLIFTRMKPSKNKTVGNK